MSSNLPQRLTLSQTQQQWASQLNPILQNLLIQGQLLSNVALINGDTAVNHGLARLPQGWFLVSPQGAATVFQTAYQPNPTLTLTLTSNASIVTDLWVF